MFPNDFPALIPPQTETETESDDLYQSRAAGGECHVMCFSPHSNLTLPLMELADICTVIREWMRLGRELSHNLYVQVTLVEHGLSVLLKPDIT